jgi:tRNA-specific 2-thiouridylase
VYHIDIEHNLLYVIDKDGEQLKAKTLIAKDRHRITPTYSHKKVSGKIRYRQNPPVPCRLKTLPDNAMKVVFDEAQRAVAPGQIFVAYQGEVCLGCGTIA